MRDDEEGLEEFRRLHLADPEARSSAARHYFRAPTNGTSTSIARNSARADQRNRRARSRGIIEMKIITGIDSAIHASWREK